MFGFRCESELSLCLAFCDVQVKSLARWLSVFPQQSFPSVIITSVVGSTKL